MTPKPTPTRSRDARTPISAVATADRAAAALRDLQERLTRAPHLLTLSGDVLVVEIDDHVSDEDIAASRVRTVVIVERGAR